jgi:hypothetical protein
MISFLEKDLAAPVSSLGYMLRESGDNDPLGSRAMPGGCHLVDFVNCHHNLAVGSRCYRVWCRQVEDLPQRNRELIQGGEGQRLVRGDHRAAIEAVRAEQEAQRIVLERVDEQVFAHVGAFVQGFLLAQIPGGAAGGEDLDDQIRCTVDVGFGDHAGVADDENIGLHHVLLRELDVGGCDEGPAGLPAQVLLNAREQVADDGLMPNARRRRHGMGGTVDKLPSLVSAPGAVVRPGECRCFLDCGLGWHVRTSVLSLATGVTVARR